MPTFTKITPGTHQCRNPGCTGRTRSNIAYYCEKCRKRIRASGAANQRTIRKPELRPYIDLARAAVQRGNASLIQSSLDRIKAALQAHCDGYVNTFHRGRACNRHMVTATSEVLKVCQAADAEEIALVVAGMYLMRHYQPRAFSDDAGFAGQLVRQVRTLHGLAMGTTITLATGKDRNWYKTLPLQATAFIANTIIESYARFVAHILTSQQQEDEKRKRIALDLARGFAIEAA
jgi:hypothetical protein